MLKTAWFMVALLVGACGGIEGQEGTSSSSVQSASSSCVFLEGSGLHCIQRSECDANCVRGCTRKNGNSPVGNYFCPESQMFTTQ